MHKKKDNESTICPTKEYKKICESNIGLYLKKRGKLKKQIKSDIHFPYRIAATNTGRR